MSVVEVEQAVDQKVKLIRGATVEYLRANPEATLKDLVGNLAGTADFGVEYLSQAIAGLLTTGEIRMDAHQRLRLSPS